MDRVTIQFYLDKAKKAKEAVKPIYNEVLKYTDLTYQITDSTTKELKPNYIDSLFEKLIIMFFCYSIRF